MKDIRLLREQSVVVVNGLEFQEKGKYTDPVDFSFVD